MVSNIKKALHLFLLFTRINFLKSLEYRINFLTAIIPTGFYSIGYIVFIKVVFEKTPAINGWTFDQMFFLFLVEQIFFYGVFFFCRHSLDTFSLAVRTGNFDSALKLPVNPRWLVSFRDQEPFLGTPALIIFALFIYEAIIMHWTIINTIFFVITNILGLFIIYNFLFLIASLAFWTTEVGEVLELSDGLIDLGRYPLGIFHPLVSGFLLFVFPITLVVFVPATVILQILDYRLLGLLFLMVPVSYLVSNYFWNLGLRRYSSASS